MELFFYAFVLTTIFNAMPGVITVETFRQAMRGGFMPAFNLQLGSVVGDLPWFFIGVAGTSWMLDAYEIKTPLMIFGVVVMLVLALQSYREARSKALDPNNSELLISGNPVVIGALLSITNPLGVLFWVGVSSTIANFTPDNPSIEDYGVFLAGYLAGVLAWSFACAWFFAWTERFITQKRWFWINILICGMFVGFAGMTVIQIL